MEAPPRRATTEISWTKEGEAIRTVILKIIRALIVIQAPTERILVLPTVVSLLPRMAFVQNVAARNIILTVARPRVVARNPRVVFREPKVEVRLAVLRTNKIILFRKVIFRKVIVIILRTRMVSRMVISILTMILMPMVIR